VGAFRPHPIDAYWPGDVLDLLLAQILEDKGEPVANVIVNRIGDEHPAGIGERFDPGSDVDAVAIEVVALDDHVAEIDADAQLDTAVSPDAGVALGHRLLHCDRAADRIDDAGKLYQQPVTGGLDDPALVLRGFELDQLPEATRVALAAACRVAAKRERTSPRRKSKPQPTWRRA
jgi:hypothetical protein